jgi:hypothetical protein
MYVENFILTTGVSTSINPYDHQTFSYSSKSSRVSEPSYVTRQSSQIFKKIYQDSRVSKNTVFKGMHMHI